MVPILVIPNIIAQYSELFLSQSCFEIFFSHLSQGKLLILLNYLFLSPSSDDFVTLFIIYLFIYIENNTWTHGDMEFIFECSLRYRTSERSERVRYRM